MVNLGMTLDQKITNAPRTVTSADDLRKLRDGSILMSGDRYPRYRDALWRVRGGMVERVGQERQGVTPFGYFKDPLPATVIYEPEASS